MQRTLILGSSSPFRKELMERLCLDFQTFSPDINEAHLDNELAENMVKRLSLEKSKEIAKQHPDALIIGSDQCAILNGRILGKPGDHANAVQQLSDSSGQKVKFLTGLCLYDSKSGEYQLDLVPYGVEFRELSHFEINNYLQKDQPYNCAGSFKAEGLGITLFKGFTGSDPTALIGLPLIRLSEMLRSTGIALPSM